MAFTLIPNSYISGEISMNGTGTYDVATTAGDCEFIPTQVIAICIASTGVLSAVTASVGTNSSNYNNIMGLQVMAGLGAGKSLPLPLNVATEIIGASSAIKCKVTLGLTLGTGTMIIVVNGYNKVAI